MPSANVFDKRECHTREIKVRLTPSMYEEFDKFRATFHDGKLNISDTLRLLIRNEIQQSYYQTAE